MKSGKVVAREAFIKPSSGWLAPLNKPYAFEQRQCHYVGFSKWRTPGDF